MFECNNFVIRSEHHDGWKEIAKEGYEPKPTDGEPEEEGEDTKKSKESEKDQEKEEGEQKKLPGSFEAILF